MSNENKDSQQLYCRCIYWELQILFLPTLWWELEAPTFLLKEHTVRLHLCPWEELQPPRFLALLICQVPHTWASASPPPSGARFKHKHQTSERGHLRMLTPLRFPRGSVRRLSLGRGFSGHYFAWLKERTGAHSCPGYPWCLQVVNSVWYTAGVFSNHKQ